MPNTWDPHSLTPEQAIQKLIDGNHRFRQTHSPISSRVWSQELAIAKQQPFAIVLGCSDSRTPVEILFDQGFGDLFVVRVAGNIVAPSIVGSIEFAASQFGTRLVVVMGHTDCGAVLATVRTLETGVDSISKNIRSITNRIAPHIEEMIRADASHRIRDAVRANVRASVDHLRHGSAILEELVQVGRVVVVGAEYEIETGMVHFFDTK